jgi:hypothetical protein
VTVFAGAALIGLVGAVAVLVALLYAAPSGIHGIWGIEPNGARLYLASFGVSADLPSVRPGTFQAGVRACLIAAWICWLALVVAAYRRPFCTTRSAVVLIASVSLAVAMVGPPVLSTDALSYVAYGRLVYVHDLNPYQSGLAELQAAGDPAAGLLFSPMFMPYGPVWPLLMAALGPLAAAVGLFAEVLLHKLLAAAALVGMAIAGARTAEARDPGRGTLTLLAIGLNPLLLIEGPLGAHNDFIAVFFLMSAAALHAGGRVRPAWFSIGLAVATKANAVAVIPLLVADHWVRRRAGDWWSGLVWLLALTLLPAVLLSLFYGGPMVLIDVVRSRLGVAEPTGSAAWIARAVLVFAFALALWMIRSGPSGAWVSAWVVVACAAVLASTTLRFPGVLVWAMAPALTAWDERHRMLITIASTGSFLLLWLYSVGL